MDQSVLTHGVVRTEPVRDRVDAWAEEVRQQGYALVESGLSAEQLRALSAKLDKIYGDQTLEIGGEAELRRCNDIDTVRCPLAHDDDFVRVAANENLIAVLKRLLGEAFVLIQQNGLLSRPGAPQYQTRWHRDLSYQHWTSSEPLAINALMTVDRFSLETGATYVLPASHLRADFPSASYVREHQRVVEAPPGTFLVLDAMLFHRAGVNASSSPRRAVNHLIGRPFMAQQIDLPSVLAGRYSDDPLLAAYLGYRWRPAPSALAWRRQRFVSK